MVELHPYEYIYYNAFAGGVAGAAGRYDLDYWGLSLAEATRDLERIVSNQRSHETPTAAPRCGRSRYTFAATRSRRSISSTPASPLHYTDEPSEADYAVGIRGAECTWEIKGRVLLEVKRGSALLSYATDLRNAAADRASSQRVGGSRCDGSCGDVARAAGAVERSSSFAMRRTFAFTLAIG